MAHPSTAASAPPSPALPRRERYKWAHSLCDPRSAGSAAQMLIAAGIGAAVGIIVRTNFGGNAEKLQYSVDWLALPGKAFVKLMKCFDLPLIALNICVGVQGILKLEKAGTVGLRTLALFMFTAACAAMQGIGVFFVFAPWILQLKRDQTAQSPSYIALQCLNGNYFQEDNSTALSCSGPPTNPELFQATIFHDLLSVPGIPHSPSEIFKTLVETFATDNFIGSFTAPNVLAVMFLSTVFGLAIARVHPAVPGGSSRVLVDFVVQLREAFIILLEYLIATAQLGVASLMAAAVASANRPTMVVVDIVLLVAAALVAYMFHTLVFMPVLLACTTRRNPWTLLWKFRFAIRKAFRTGSADDALDKTVECAIESGEVSPAIAGFVLPLGIDLNLCGAGIYYPLAVLYLASVSGYMLDVTWGTIVIIVFVSTMSSIGSHVMPNGGIIMILAIWQACFMGTYDAPLELAFVLVTQWIFDRCVAACNVVSDVVIAKIVDATTNGGQELLQDVKLAAAAHGEGDAGGQSAHGGRGHSPNTNRRSIWDTSSPHTHGSPLGALVDVSAVINKRRALAAAGLTNSSVRSLVGPPNRRAGSSASESWGGASSLRGSPTRSDSVSPMLDAGGEDPPRAPSGKIGAAPAPLPPTLVISSDYLGGADLEMGRIIAAGSSSSPRLAAAAPSALTQQPQFEVPHVLNERFARAALASRQARVANQRRPHVGTSQWLPDGSRPGSPSSVAGGVGVSAASSPRVHAAPYSSVFNFVGTGATDGATAHPAGGGDRGSSVSASSSDSSVVAVAGMELL